MMSRRVLVGLVIGIAAAYGGLKLYIAHSISQTADKLVVLAAPVASIRYQGTTSSLDGTVGLKGISVEVLETGDTYYMDAFKLKTDSIFTLLDLDGRLRKGEMPKTFGIAIENMMMPVSTQLLEHAHGDPGLWGSLQLPYGSLACGDRDGFSADDLYNMGLASTTTSMEIEVQREPIQGDIRFHMHVASSGLNTGDVELVVAAPDGTLDPRAAMSAPPQFEFASLKLQDQGWHKKVLDYCANQTGMDKQAYIDAHVAALKRALASDGIGVGDTLTDAYRQFLNDGGTMTLAFRPAGAVDLGSLHLYSLEDTLAYLGTHISVNGQEVTPLDIAMVKPEVAAAAKALQEAASENVDFEEIGITELYQHVGEQVRLTTQSERVFQGKLVDIQDRIAHVDVRLSGRVYEEIVLLPKVKKIEVEVLPTQDAASE